MSKQTTTPRFPAGRRGVALLVVIGLLSLLLISAVAFTILMRIERGGASNYRHASSARQMVHAALARAIAEIDASHPGEDPSGNPVSVNDLVYPPWTNKTWQVIGKYIRTIADVPDEVLFSVDPNLKEGEDPFHARVLSERMMQFVPAGFREAVERARPEWIGFETGGRVVGRYAYIVLNTSGLLDANIVGSNGVARAEGSNPGEIRVDPTILPEVTSQAAFATGRDANARYETIEELRTLSNTGLNGAELANFNVFSYALRNETAPDGKPKLYVGGDLEGRSTDAYAPGQTQTVEARLREILSKPELLGNAYYVTGDDAAEIAQRVNQYIQALFDYIDADSIPRGFDFPNTEDTFMISGLVWYPSYTWSGAATRIFQHRYRIGFWAWRPFAGTDTGDYTAEVTVKRLDQPIMTQPAGAAAAAFQNSLIPTDPGRTWTVPMTRSGTRFLAGEVTGTNTATVAAAVAGNFFISNPNYYRIGVSIRLTKSSVGVVDAVPGVAAATGVELQWPTFGTALHGRPVANPVFVPEGQMWAETFDPRFNWSPSETRYLHWQNNSTLSTYTWPGYSASCRLYATGSFLEYVLQNPALLGSAAGEINRIFDGLGKRRLGGTDTPWFDALTEQQSLPSPANRPLRSVGEMALIAYDHWLTMRLYHHRDADGFRMLPAAGYHRLFDWFTMTPPADAAKPRRGLVNVNTRQQPALDSVFFDMPLREWNTAAPLRLNAAAAQGVSDEILARTAGMPVTNITDLGELAWYDSTLATAAGMANEMDREAPLRNAYQLLTTRQQTYLILLRADAFSTKFGQTTIRQGNVLSTAQAIALLWRDPVPDADGNHRCFVQLLKHLTD